MLILPERNQHIGPIYPAAHISVQRGFPIADHRHGTERNPPGFQGVQQLYVLANQRRLVEKLLKRLAAGVIQLRLNNTHDCPDQHQRLLGIFHPLEDSIVPTL